MCGKTAVVALLLIGAAVGVAEWLSTDSTSEPTPPTITIVSNSDAGTVIDVVVHGVTRQQRVVDTTVFDAIALPGHGLACLDIGKPELPKITHLLGIPDGASVNVQFTALDSVTFDSILCWPYQGPQVEDSTYPFVIDQDFYNKDTFYPFARASLMETGIWRDLAVANIQDYPARNNPQTRKLRVYSWFRISVSYSGGGYGFKVIQPWIGSLYQRYVDNFNWLNVDIRDDAPDARLLVLCPSCLYNETLQTLLEWHRRQGNPTRAIVKPYWSNLEMRDSIKLEYSRSPHHTLRWVLIVGDVSLMPCMNIGGADYSDYGYAELDSQPGETWADGYPEVGVGRLADSGSLNLYDPVGKTLKYVKNPLESVPNTNWLKHLTFVSWPNDTYNLHFYYRDSTRYLYHLNDSMPFYQFAADTIMGRDYGNDAVTGAFYSGTGIMIYRGHGRPDGQGWKEWGMDRCNWMVSDVEVLPANSQTAVVYNLCCHCGEIQRPQCLTKAWMARLRGGAVATLGASGQTYPLPSHLMAQTILRCTGDTWPVRGIYLNPAFDLGWTMCNVTAALAREWTDYHYRDNIYRAILLGDPVTEVWSGGVPELPQVFYPSQIPPGPTPFLVSVRAHGGYAVPNALVCLAKDTEVYARGYTNQAGQVVLSGVCPRTIGVMHVTVSGGHLANGPTGYEHMPILPFEGACEVFDGSNVLHLKSIIDDAPPGGDGSGGAGPGETVNLPTWVRNTGPTQAFEVRSVLRMYAPGFATVLDSVKNFPLVLPNDSAFTGPDGFEFTVDPACPYGFQILCSLHCWTASGKHTASEFRIVVSAGLPILSDSLATFPTQGRHLVRMPNTSMLHAVYQSSGRVLYQVSPDGGQAWFPAETIAFGTNPCISLDYNGLPWITYIQADSLCCKIKRPTTGNDWRSIRIYHNGLLHLGTSSMVCSNWRDDAIPPNERPPDMGYVVFSLYHPGYDTSQGMLFFTAFDTLYTATDGNYHYALYQLDQWYEPQDADSLPCIARTPGDRVHMTWQKGGPDNTGTLGRVFYCADSVGTNPAYIRKNPTNAYAFSAPFDLTDSTTRPGSSPSIEAWGDSAFATWRVGYYTAWPGQIWRRSHWVDDRHSVWSDARRRDTLDYDNGSPVMSTRSAIAWREWHYDGYSITSRFEGDDEPFRIYNTPNELFYPHSDVTLAPPVPPWEQPGPDIERVLFTERVGPGSFALKFKSHNHFSSNSSITGMFYSVAVGDSVQSPYCLQRDGAQDYHGHRVDHARNHLRYRLPFLNPLYRYLLRTVVYHEGHGRWQQQYKLNDNSKKTIDADSGKADTTWLDIPPELYGDGEVDFKVERVQGDEAVLEDLSLFQYESSTGYGEGGAQASGITRVGPALTLYSVAPNPATGAVRIRYLVPGISHASLQILDPTGRRVRTLVETPAGAVLPGLRTVVWDKRNDNGEPVSEGIYFCRLETEVGRITRKLVLVR